MTVTFCGHSSISDEGSVRIWLAEVIQNAIHNGANLFLLGGYGAFDRMAAGVVRSLKTEFPFIQSIFSFYPIWTER